MRLVSNLDHFIRRWESVFDLHLFLTFRELRNLPFGFLPVQADGRGLQGCHTPSRSQKEKKTKKELGIRSHRCRQCSRQQSRHPAVRKRSWGSAFLREWPSVTLCCHHGSILTASNRPEELRRVSENGHHDAVIFNNELPGKF